MTKLIKSFEDGLILKFHLNLRTKNIFNPNLKGKKNI